MSNSTDGKSADRVIGVAAAVALPEYLNYSAYMCQPNRPFKPGEHMAFYTNNKINRHIPKILGRPIESISRDEVETRTDLSDIERTRLKILLKKLDAAKNGDRLKHPHKIFFLTSPDSPDTLVLPHDIEHNPISNTPRKRRPPFIRKQRYISFSSLKKGPQYTSGLTNA